MFHYIPARKDTKRGKIHQVVIRQNYKSRERRINSIAPPTHHKTIFPTCQNGSTTKPSDLESVITPSCNTPTTHRHFNEAAPTSADMGAEGSRLVPSPSDSLNNMIISYNSISTCCHFLKGREAKPSEYDGISARRRMAPFGCHDDSVLPRFST